MTEVRQVPEIGRCALLQYASFFSSTRRKRRASTYYNRTGNGRECRARRAVAQTLHAQTKPPAYNIAEIAIKDQDGYNKEYLPLITKALTDAGGKFIVRGGKTISFEGAPPAPRVVVIQFESLEKLQALYESAPYKQAVAIGDKYATQRIFGVEGVSP